MDSANLRLLKASIQTQDHTEDSCCYEDIETDRLYRADMNAMLAGSLVQIVDDADDLEACRAVDRCSLHYLPVDELKTPQEYFTLGMKQGGWHNDRLCPVLMELNDASRNTFESLRLNLNRPSNEQARLLVGELVQSVIEEFEGDSSKLVARVTEEIRQLIKTYSLRSSHTVAIVDKILLACTGKQQDTGKRVARNASRQTESIFESI